MIARIDSHRSTRAAAGSANSAGTSAAGCCGNEDGPSMMIWYLGGIDRRRKRQIRLDVSDMEDFDHET